MDLKTLIASLFIGAAFFLWSFPVSACVGRLVRRFEESLEGVLAELFLFNITPRRITFMVCACVALTTLMFFGLLGGPLGVLVGLAFGAGIPLLVFVLMVRRRRSKLETQLLDGLITLANGMRAGLNLGQALALVEQHGKPPLSQEFGLILREIEHGTSIDVALDNASRRLKSHNFRLLFASMKTTRIRGGNMPETLDRLGESLREIVRLEEKVRSQTAQGRMTALFMAFMPPVVLLIYNAFDPKGVALLFNETIGQLLLAVAAVMTIAGFIWIRRLVSFEI